MSWEDVIQGLHLKYSLVFFDLETTEPKWV